MGIIPSVCGKLRARLGETITEVLVALLVLALGLLLLAGMLSAAGRIVTDSKGIFEDYAAAENILAAQSSSESSEKVDISVGNITVHKSSDTLRLTDSSGTSLPVTYYENTVLTNKPVISYGPDTD